MRVLHITTAFPRSDSDVITPWLVELLKRLRAHGIEAEVLTSSYKGLGDHVYEGIPVHRFRYCFRRWENLTHEETAPDRMRKSVLYRVLPAFFVGAGVIAAWRLARTRSYDIVHVHWPLPLAILGWAAARASGARTVTLFYGVELRWVAGAMRSLRGFLRWAIRRSDRVVAISSYTAREVQALVPVPVDVIPYTFELSGATPPVARDRAQFHVLFVGRLVERKGVAHLIDAFARLALASDARLIVVGDGPEREALQARARRAGIADRVVFPGKVSDAELRAAYASADVFVLPSVVDARGDTEGLGVVLLEAMNFGVPVVGSGVGGIPDIVIDGETGLLTPPGDVEALASALRKLAEDRGLAERLGAAGRHHLKSRFTWDAIIADWIRLYDDVLRPGGGA